MEWNKESEESECLKKSLVLTWWYLHQIFAILTQEGQIKKMVYKNKYVDEGKPDR